MGMATIMVGMRACAWRNHVEAGWKPLCCTPKQVAPKRLHLPGRRDDIDIADVQTLIVECSLQRAKRELSRMFLSIEPFFLQDDRWNAIVEQRQAGVMGPGYDAENVHESLLMGSCSRRPIVRRSNVTFTTYNNGRSTPIVPRLGGMRR